MLADILGLPMEHANAAGMGTLRDHEFKNLPGRQHWHAIRRTAQASLRRDIISPINDSPVDTTENADLGWPTVAVSFGQGDRYQGLHSLPQLVIWVIILGGIDLHLTLFTDGHVLFFMLVQDGLRCE